MTENEGFTCHWTHVHGPHDWTPIIVDPDNPQILHVDIANRLPCPGLKVAKT